MKNSSVAGTVKISKENNATKPKNMMRIEFLWNYLELVSKDMESDWALVKPQQSFQKYFFLLFMALVSSVKCLDDNSCSLCDRYKGYTEAEIKDIFSISGNLFTDKTIDKVVINNNTSRTITDVKGRSAAKKYLFAYSETSGVNKAELRELVKRSIRFFYSEKGVDILAQKLQARFDAPTKELLLQETRSDSSLKNTSPCETAAEYLVHQFKLAYIELVNNQPMELPQEKPTAPTVHEPEPEAEPEAKPATEIEVKPEPESTPPLADYEREYLNAVKQFPIGTWGRFQYMLALAEKGNVLAKYETASVYKNGGMFRDENGSSFLVNSEAVKFTLFNNERARYYYLSSIEDGLKLAKHEYNKSVDAGEVRRGSVNESCDWLCQRAREEFEIAEKNTLNESSTQALRKKAIDSGFQYIAKLQGLGIPYPDLYLLLYQHRELLKEVNGDLPQLSVKEPVELLKKAAEYGSGEGACLLAEYYEENNEKSTAEKWYQKAEKLRSVRAAKRLAEQFSEDDEDAFFHKRMAALFGDVEAMAEVLFAENANLQEEELLNMLAVLRTNHRIPSHTYTRLRAKIIQQLGKI